MNQRPRGHLPRGCLQMVQRRWHTSRRSLQSSCVPVCPSLRNRNTRRKPLQQCCSCSSSAMSATHCSYTGLPSPLCARTEHAHTQFCLSTLHICRSTFLLAPPPHALSSVSSRLSLARSSRLWATEPQAQVRNANLCLGGANGPAPVLLPRRLCALATAPVFASSPKDRAVPGCYLCSVTSRVCRVEF